MTCVWRLPSGRVARGVLRLCNLSFNLTRAKGASYKAMHVFVSLVPRPLPAFQCCTLKNGKAWFAKSREIRHY